MTWPLPSRFSFHGKIPRQSGGVEFYCQDFGNFDVSQKLINSLRTALGDFCALGFVFIRVELDIRSPQILQLFQGENHFGRGEAHVVVAILSFTKPQADIEFQTPDSALLHRGQTIYKSNECCRLPEFEGVPTVEMVTCFLVNLSACPYIGKW